MTSHGFLDQQQVQQDLQLGHFSLLQLASELVKHFALMLHLLDEGYKVLEA
jgi:uncharacterized membrane-anchored protein YhcB (DUF1043 family)